MTWGQLRFELARFATGVDLDRLTSFLRLTAEEWVGDFPWSDLRRTGFFFTSAEYSTGTVTVTQGSRDVVGVDTAWTSTLDGREFRIGDSELTGITTTGATTAQLDHEWTGETQTGAAYRISQRIYPVVAECRYVVSVHAPGMDTPLAKNTPLFLNTYRPKRNEHGEPWIWAPGPTTEETSAPIVRTIELYCIPTESRRYAYTYQFSPIPFTGLNTQDEVHPSMVTGALLDGAKARVCEEIRELRDFGLADRMRQRFFGARQRALAEEMRRAGPSRLQLDPALVGRVRESED